MERTGEAGGTSLFRLAAIVIILALATMHNPPAAHATSAPAHPASTVNAHVTGSACKTMHEDPGGTIPIPPENPPQAPDAQTSHPRPSGGIFVPVPSRTLLSIWRL